jgi:hypothetical protein
MGGRLEGMNGQPDLLPQKRSAGTVYFRSTPDRTGPDRTSVIIRCQQKGYPEDFVNGIHIVMLVLLCRKHPIRIPIRAHY